MSELFDKVKAFAKEKPAVTAGIVVVGVGGLYLLSKSSGGGLSLGGALPTDTNATQPGQGQGQQPGSGQSNGGGDLAGIANQLAEQQTQNASFQSKIQDALAAVVDQFNQAIGQSNAANQSGLSALAAQTNSALSGFAQQQTVPDFSGFQSQLVGNLQSQLDQIRAASTGQLQQYLSPSQGFNSNIPLPRAPQIAQPVKQVAFNFGNFLGSLARPVFPTPTPFRPTTALGQFVPRAVPNYTQQFANSLARLTTGSVINKPAPVVKLPSYAVSTQKAIATFNKVKAK